MTTFGEGWMATTVEGAELFRSVLDPELISREQVEEALVRFHSTRLVAEVEHYLGEENNG